jgi:hypothetical protein
VSSTKRKSAMSKTTAGYMLPQSPRDSHSNDGSPIDDSHCCPGESCSESSLDQNGWGLLTFVGRRQRAANEMYGSL